LIDEEFKVLKAMSEATNKMDLNAFSRKVGFSPAETVEQIQQLAKEGFLQKVGGGFGITNKGKAALKALSPVPEGMSFQFYYGLNQPAQLSATTLKEFYVVIRQISIESIEFHLYRRDFENWIKDAVKDPELAHEIEHFREEELKNDELKKAILKKLDASYNIRDLI